MAALSRRSLERSSLRYKLDGNKYSIFFLTIRRLSFLILQSGDDDKGLDCPQSGWHEGKRGMGKYRGGGGGGQL